MKRGLLLLICGGVLLLPGRLPAQAERFELGQRLRAFEIDFESCADPAARQRAAPSLKRTVWVPFSLQPGRAGQTLDQARFALQSAEAPSAERQWAESLWLSPATRFVAAGTTELALSLQPFYAVDHAVPRDALLRLTLTSRAGETLIPGRECGITALPLHASLALAGVAEGDHVLRMEIDVAGKPLVRRQFTISVAINQVERLQALRQAVDALPLTPPSSERESVRNLTDLLERLANRETLETNYPAQRLLAESETALRTLAQDEPFYSAKRPGDYWLTLAAADRLVPVRMLVPRAATAGKPLPLVVALHGASGSENLFFEGYGQGAIVKLCQERGWLLVAPRLSALGGPFPVPEIVDEVARLYPVARQHIYLVGHSMGAAQAVLNTSRTPERFAAVAALGGGGLVRASDPFKAIPFFIGVGSEDFALSWARNLNLNLRNAGVAKVDFHEYPGIEHIAITQVALGDVFRWLDEIAQRK